MSRSKSQRKILLVSRDLQKADFTQYLVHVMKIAEQHQADTVSFALFSVASPDRVTWRKLFGSGKHVKTVMLEAGMMVKEDASGLVNQTWVRHKARASLAHRQFARSSEPTERKEALIRQVRDRIHGDTICVVCGELNILSVKRPKHNVIDPFGFRKLLRENGVKLIVNALHTGFRRFECRLKMIALAKSGRVLVSVWNQDSERKGDLRLPWVAYKGGRKLQVCELDRPIAARPDIRMGLVTI